jgi:hypothetical protein
VADRNLITATDPPQNVFTDQQLTVLDAMVTPDWHGFLASVSRGILDSNYAICGAPRVRIPDVAAQSDAASGVLLLKLPLVRAVCCLGSPGELPLVRALRGASPYERYLRILLDALCK